MSHTLPVQIAARGVLVGTCLFLPVFTPRGEVKQGTPLASTPGWETIAGWSPDVPQRDLRVVAGVCSGGSPASKSIGSSESAGGAEVCG